MANPDIKKHAKKAGWQKGQSGNPKGSSGVARLGGDIKRMSVEQIAEVGSIILQGDMATLYALADDPTTTGLKGWTAKLVVQSMEKGDSATYERILNRIVGRVKDVIEISGVDGRPMEVRSVGEMQAELAAIRKANEEMGDD